MKKYILVLMVAVSLTACGSHSSVETVVSEDSVLTKYKIDTIKVDSTVVDSVKK